MRSPYRIALASVLGATLFAAAAARAELTFPVNDNAGVGVFDQPSVVMNGAVAHVAFIGAATPAGPFHVYYAAVNGGADFSNLALRRDGIIVTPPTPVDNTGANDNAYFDARHPAIALRTPTEAVIFFQAKPNAATDTAYLLYRTRLTLDNNAVVAQSVLQVTNMPAGDIEDVSFAIVAADNTARVAFAHRTAIAPTGPFQLSFARVGLDNAVAAPTVAITASYTQSQGFRPIPSLRLDDLSRAHIAWAATDNTGSSPGPVYYALVKETNGVDNMVIAPTQIMTGRGAERYSFPNLLVFGRSLITVIASDEVDGDLGYVQINPDAARQNGLPAWDNLSSNNSFLLVPPGDVILPPEFRLFRPETFYEAASGRIFMTGYGSGGTNPTGATFLAIKLNAAGYTADIVTGATPFATEELPSSIDNDYTKAAFGFPGGKIVAFWSGRVDTDNRNLDVTTVPTVAAWITQQEHGCAMVSEPGRGEAGRIPGALLLFLPAAVLAARRIVVNRGRRPATREPLPGARRPEDG